MVTAEQKAWKHRRFRDRSFEITKKASPVFAVFDVYLRVEEEGGGACVDYFVYGKPTEHFCIPVKEFLGLVEWCDE